VRDVRWASRHLGKPDAEPPSDGARFLLAWGREHPDRLLALLARLDAPGDKADQPGREGGGNGAPIELRYEKAVRAKALLVPAREMRRHVRFDRTAGWAQNLPEDAQVVWCEADPAREGVVLVLTSGEFPLVPAGEPVAAVDLAQLLPESNPDRGA
jgi:hypothetical protein